MAGRAVADGHCKSLGRLCRACACHFLGDFCYYEYLNWNYGLGEPINADFQKASAKVKA